MKHIDLFSGIGGFSCASHTLGFTTARWADVNAFAQRVMSTRFPDASGHDDVTKMEYIHGEADLITGGFPCQDFSRTRQDREHIEDKLKMWKQLYRAIKEVQPTYAIGENVHGLLGDVNHDAWLEIRCDLDDLERDGYEIFPVVISAKALGGPHFRPRLFLPMRKQVARVSVPRESYWSYDNIPSIVGEATYENKRALTAYGNAVAVPVAHFVLSLLLSVDSLAEAFTDLRHYPNAHAIRYFKDSVPFIQARRGAYNRPTPVASDYKGASQKGRRRGTLCEETVKEVNPPDGETVYPNAAFAEWMMGFPVGWCAV